MRAKIVKPSSRGYVICGAAFAEQDYDFAEASNMRPLPAALHFIPWRLAGQVMRYLCELRGRLSFRSQRYVSCIPTVVDPHATKPLHSGLRVRVVLCAASWDEEGLLPGLALK